MLPSNRGFWKAFLLNIVTLGFYSWYLIYAFAKETNIACKGDGKKTTGLLLYLIFSLITLNIYAIIWNCKWISRCNTYLAVNNKPQGLQVSTYLIAYFLGPLTLFILNIIVFCKSLYLQNAVNATYNSLHSHHRLESSKGGDTITVIEEETTIGAF